MKKKSNESSLNPDRLKYFGVFSNNVLLPLITKCESSLILESIVNGNVMRSYKVTISNATEKNSISSKTIIYF